MWVFVVSIDSLSLIAFHRVRFVSDTHLISVFQILTWYPVFQIFTKFGVRPDSARVVPGDPRVVASRSFILRSKNSRLKNVWASDLCHLQGFKSYFKVLKFIEFCLLVSMWVYSQISAKFPACLPWWTWRTSQKISKQLVYWISVSWSFEINKCVYRNIETKTSG